MITFLNKYDRPGRNPLELLDEIEKQIELRPTPATWPVGDGDAFQGLIDRRTGRYTKFTRTARGASAAAEETTISTWPRSCAANTSAAWKAALDECSLLDAIGADVDMPSFLAGRDAVLSDLKLTNFGGGCSRCVMTWRHRPSQRATVRKHGLETPVLAFVFQGPAKWINRTATGAR